MHRPPLLLGLMAGAAALTMAVNIGAAASPPQHAPPPAPAQPQSRMGAMLADDIAQRDRRQTAQTRALDLREQAAKTWRWRR